MTSETPAQWVPIDELVPWPGNPRTNDDAVAAVAESIDRFGWGAVILARRENREVIAGHTRLKAARRLNLSEVPVRYLDLTEPEAHALALADNRVGELAQWSDELADVLREIGSGTDLTGLGFTGSELESLLGPSDYDDVDWRTFSADIGDGAEGGKSITCPSCDHRFKA